VHECDPNFLREMRERDIINLCKWSNFDKLMVVSWVERERESDLKGQRLKLVKI
jgi:hypothetical protein